MRPDHQIIAYAIVALTIIALYVTLIIAYENGHLL